jgi:hypothetical protein
MQPLARDRRVNVDNTERRRPIYFYYTTPLHLIYNVTEDEMTQQREERKRFIDGRKYSTFISARF